MRSTIFLKVCSWNFCSSRDPIPCHDVYTGCLPFASSTDSCSTAFLFSSHKPRTPLLLLSLPLSKRVDHLRKRYHLERLLMLLRLEDEDPTSSMVVSKIEATQKPRSGKSKLSRRHGGADGAAIGERNPISARGVLLQLYIAASDSSFGVARLWREYFQCPSLSLRPQSQSACPRAVGDGSPTRGIVVHFPSGRLRIHVATSSRRGREIVTQELC